MFLMSRDDRASWGKHGRFAAWAAVIWAVRARKVASAPLRSSRARSRPETSRRMPQRNVGDHVLNSSGSLGGIGGTRRSSVPPSTGLDRSAGHEPAASVITRRRFWGGPPPHGLRMRAATASRSIRCGVQNETSQSSYFTARSASGRPAGKCARQPSMSLPSTPSPPSSMVLGLARIAISRDRSFGPPSIRMPPLHRTLDASNGTCPGSVAAAALFPAGDPTPPPRRRITSVFSAALTSLEEEEEEEVVITESFLAGFSKSSSRGAASSAPAAEREARKAEAAAARAEALEAKAEAREAELAKRAEALEAKKAAYAQRMEEQQRARAAAATNKPARTTGGAGRPAGTISIAPKRPAPASGTVALGTSQKPTPEGTQAVLKSVENIEDLEERAEKLRALADSLAARAASAEAAIDGPLANALPFVKKARESYAEKAAQKAADAEAAAKAAERAAYGPDAGKRALLVGSLAAIAATAYAVLGGGGEAPKPRTQAERTAAPAAAAPARRAGKGYEVGAPPAPPRKDFFAPKPVEKKESEYDKMMREIEERKAAPPAAE
mmetsp:Transcript_46105/g.147503  ORF Transcript_46105/g.147503 Transcript_46105/m.147503 type:complete len:555 (+) Transcript_46105:774-2438(+)